MNFATQWYIQEKLNRLAADARSASRRVRQADTLRQVRDWGQVHPDSVISSMKNSVPELRFLERARQEQAEVLVTRQLADLAKLVGDEVLFEQKFGNLRRNEWPFLRGEHGVQLHRIERELARLKRAIPPADSSADTSL